MSKRETITSLDTLVRVRSTEVERMQTALAKKEATRARYQASVERLTALAEGSGPAGQPAGARALASYLSEARGTNTAGWALVFGAMKDKDVEVSCNK